MEFNRAQLKRDVKLSMKVTMPNPLLVSLLFSVVVSAGTWLINTILGGLLTGNLGNWSTMILAYIQAGYELDEAVEQAMLTLLSMGVGALFSVIVGGTVLSILVALWQSVMNVGYEGWCLSMVRGENPPVSKIFGALPEFGPVLITRVLTGVFEFLWAMLMVAGYAVVLAAAVMINIPVLTGLLVLADVAALVLAIIWVTMRYALVDYALLDKGLSGMDAVRESKRLMRGNIGRGFMLQLSFAGWYFLVLAIIYGGIILAVLPIMTQASSASTGGLIAASGAALLILGAAAIVTVVLVLWLRPYTNGCWARFYDWACGAADGFPGGPGFGGGPGGWGGHRDYTNYTWSSGAGSGRGTGMGPDPGKGGSLKPPKPKDDPWN